MYLVTQGRQDGQRNVIPGNIAGCVLGNEIFIITVGCGNRVAQYNMNSAHGNVNIKGFIHPLFYSF